MVGKVSLQELKTSELFLAELVAALKGLCASLELHRSSILSLKTYIGLPLGVEREVRRVTQRVF